MRKQLEECMQNSTSTCPPATIDTTSNKQQATAVIGSDDEDLSAMDQRVSRRPPSSIKTGKMRVGCMGMMYENSMTVGIAKRRSQATMTHTRVLTHNQVQVKRTRSCRSGNGGAGSHSLKEKLQTKEVE